MNPQEFQLILHCARPRPDPGSVRELVSKGIDWQLFLELAAQNRVRPMLRKALKEVCWDAVPLNIQHELALFNEANTQKNLRFTGELLQLLGLFQEESIPMAAVKGPVLAHSVYGDLSLREFSDLDVVVQKADLHKAEDILIARGYQADFPDRDYRSAFVSYQGQYAFRNNDSGISVDLHWRLASKGVAFPLQLPNVWANLQHVTIAGRRVPTLALDDLTLFIAAHGSKEGWRYLAWVCDFAEVLHKYHNIDWIGVLDRSQRSHSSRALLLAIALASTLLDAPAPLTLIERAWNNSAVRALAEQAKAKMLRSTPEQPHSEDELGEFLKGLNMHDRLAHRLWPVTTLVTTRTVGDFRAMPLPKSLWGIYYLTRPFRLTGKVLKMLFRKYAEPFPETGR